MAHKKQQKLVHMLGTLAPMWETEIQLLAPGYGLTQPWPLQASEKLNQQVEDLQLFLQLLPLLLTDT